MAGGAGRRGGLLWRQAQSWGQVGDPLPLVDPVESNIELSLKVRLQERGWESWGP